MITALLVTKCLANQATDIATQLNSNKFVNSNTNIDDIIFGAINSFLIILDALAIISIIIGGIYYISSAGDDNKATKGKLTIVFALIGVVVASLGLVFLHFAKNTAQDLTMVPERNIMVEQAHALKLRDIIGRPEEWDDLNALPNQLSAGDPNLSTNMILLDSPINTFFKYAMIAGFCALLVGAFYYITSYGDPTKADKGKKIILFVVIGIFFLFVGWTITRVLINTQLGVTP